MPFDHGNTNGLGRPKGSRNKRTAELFARLDARGDIDSADFLSSIVTNPNEPQEQRIQASGLLLPYRHPKMGTVPMPRYVDQPIQLPDFQSLEEAEAYLKQLAVRMA